MNRAWREPAPADAERHPPEEVFAAGERNHHVSNTAYPLAHGLTWRPYRIADRARHPEVVAEAFAGLNELCLYSHLPFCEVRCSYCEYTVVGREELPRVREYMGWLSAELRLYRELLGTQGRTLHGFDLGGGTPSVVPAELIAEHLEEVRGAFRFAPGMEVSIETTPKIAAREPRKLADWRRAGIGRISMGIQVIEPRLLRILNREENGAELHRAGVDHIREAGFEKLNLDLMYGFADQTLEGWRATLEHALSLAPEYVTLYRVRYKLTRLSRDAARVSLEAVRAQAGLAKEVLRQAGYRANPGKNTWSRIPGDPGTSHYLTRRVVDGMPYLGLGLGAQSFTETTISYNDGAAGKRLEPYRRSVEAGRLPLQDVYLLPRTQMMAKMAAVSFYFGEIDRAAFRTRFRLELEQAFPEELALATARGWVELTGRALSLTELGAKHFNGVIALFFAPSVQAWLLSRDPDRARDMERVLHA